MRRAGSRLSGRAASSPNNSPPFRSVNIVFIAAMIPTALCCLRMTFRITKPAALTVITGVASVIVGARTPEQLASNLRSSAVELTVDDLRLLDEASDPEPAPWPYGAAGLEQRSRPFD